MQPPSGCAPSPARPGAQERAQRVRLEKVAHVCGRHVLQFLALPRGRAVDEDVEPAEARQRLLDQPSNRPFVRQVRLHADRLNPAVAEVGDRLLRLGLGAAVVDGKGVAALRQRLRHVPADAALAAAGHQGHLRSHHRQLSQEKPQLPTQPPNHLTT
jgi:hypothetical protein